jgi:uncharacterized membrane protein
METNKGGKMKHWHIMLIVSILVIIAVVIMAFFNVLAGFDF